MNTITRIVHADINDALKPTERDGQKMIDARQLHTWLQVDTPFSDWIKRRLKEYSFDEGSDFVCNASVRGKGRGGWNRKEYLLTLDMAKELSMVERTERGRETRRYFIAMEKKVIDLSRVKNMRHLATPKAPTLTLVSRPGLFKLIQRSNKPEAKEFDRWGK